MEPGRDGIGPAGAIACARGATTDGRERTRTAPAYPRRGAATAGSEPPGGRGAPPPRTGAGGARRGACRHYETHGGAPADRPLDWARSTARPRRGRRIVAGPVGGEPGPPLE